MQQKRTERRASFKVVSEAGDSQTFDLYVDVIVSNTMSGIVEKDGLRSIRDKSGRPVNLVGERRYQIVGQPAIWTSDDPNAP